MNRNPVTIGRRLLNFLFCILLFQLGLMLPAGEVSAAEVIATDVRVGDHGNSTRFVLDLSKAIDIGIFSLKSPFRIVLDMPEVGWQLPAKPLPVNIGLLKTLRYGLFKIGHSRVVIETTRSVNVKSAFFLKNKEGSNRRFVLDMVPSETHAVRIGSIKALIVKGENPENSLLTTPDPLFSEGYSASPTVKKDTNLTTSVSESILLPAPKKPLLANLQNKRVIVLDPGHGGADPGAIGPSGIFEKQITIAMARELKTILEASGRYKVVLTRNQDKFIKLRDRVEISRKSGAELFISIHADSIKNKKISGSSVYTLSEKASDKEAAMLAERENKVDLIAGIDLSGETKEVTNILIDLAQRESMNESASFANILVGELKRNSKVLRNTHRFAGFAVLKAPDVPSVLLELGFLSNPIDERNLRSKDYRKKIGMSVLQGIDNYFLNVQQASSN